MHVLAAADADGDGDAVCSLLLPLVMQIPMTARHWHWPDMPVKATDMILIVQLQAKTHLAMALTTLSRPH